MARSLRVLLVAEEAAGVQTLRLVTDARHQVVAVVTASSAGGLGSGATVAAVASRAGIPVFPLRRVQEAAFAEHLRGEPVDLLLNVHALRVLPPELVAAPRIGSFNLHPGPLPDYAGLNAPSWAIYNGERTHAVTVHWMDAGIDTGPIAYETPLDISEDDTGFSLSAKCVRAGLPLLEQLLADAADGTVPRQPQARRTRRYYGREVPQGGVIDWNRPAARIVNFVRASDYLPFSSPWGHPKAWMGGRELSILKAIRTWQPCSGTPGRIGSRMGDDVLVATSDEWVQLRRVQLGATVSRAGHVLEPGQRFDLAQRAEETLGVAR